MVEEPPGQTNDALITTLHALLPGRWTLVGPLCGPGCTDGAKKTQTREGGSVTVYEHVQKVHVQKENAALMRFRQGGG